jgi:hypothetical protein
VTQVLLTANSTNCFLEWDGPGGLVTSPIGTPLVLDPVAASTTARVVKLNAQLPAQVELLATDCGGNGILAAPVIAELRLKGRSLTRTFKRLPDARH